jgi:hypothetical protein
VTALNLSSPYLSVSCVWGNQPIAATWAGSLGHLAAGDCRLAGDDPIRGQPAGEVGDRLDLHGPHAATDHRPEIRWVRP